MNRYLRLTLLAIVTVALAACGEETNKPGTPITATVVASATTSGHTHSITIPFTDLGSTNQINYTSTTINGHTHVVALSAQQFSDLKAGMQVTLTSSAAADGHSHTWLIQGGSVLYDSLCYNCHSNDKRGTSGMSSSPLNGTQRSALQNPSGAPFSTALPADPNLTPAPVIVPATDGAALYKANCETCHGPLATSQKRGRSATQIRSAITANTGGMGGLSSLSDTELQAIATALQ